MEGKVCITGRSYEGDINLSVVCDCSHGCGDSWPSLPWCVYGACACLAISFTGWCRLGRITALTRTPAVYNLLDSGLSR